MVPIDLQSDGSETAGEVLEMGQVGLVRGNCQGGIVKCVVLQLQLFRLSPLHVHVWDDLSSTV